LFNSIDRYKYINNDNNIVASQKEWRDRIAEEDQQGDPIGIFFFFIFFRRPCPETPRSSGLNFFSSKLKT
jgi:hypothetical protein